MAVDKLVDSSQLDSDLTSVADAIRSKGGTSDTLSFPSGMVNAINNISTGGAGAKIKPYSISFRYSTNKTLDLSTIDTSRITSFGSMFADCTNLESLDASSFDTSKVTSMYATFNNCVKLDGANLNISTWDTSKVTTFSGMFNNAPNRINLPTLNAEACTNVAQFSWSNNALKNFNGLIDLGKAYLTSRIENYYDYEFKLSDNDKLTEDSLINILNNLYDIATKGCNVQKCTIGSTNVAKLTSEAGQQALQNAATKGWTVS